MILSKIDPRIKAGLSASTVRLITNEAEPDRPAYVTDEPVIPSEYYTQSARRQVQSVVIRASRRTVRRRG